MDNVNHPAHYNTGKYESIDVMIETQGAAAVKDFCICNAFKYIYRYRNKNGLEDIKKAIWYLNKYVELEESKPNNLQIDCDTCKHNIDEDEGDYDIYCKILAVEDDCRYEPIDIVRCEDCKYKQKCRKAVEHITHEPTSVNIGYKSVDFCSYGEREGE